MDNSTRNSGSNCIKCRSTACSRLANQHFSDREESSQSLVEPNSSDIYIAVMGMTGAGKSTFISLCTDEEVVIGHNLEACTQEVRLFKCNLFSTVNVYLLDTPGFDDTTRSDTEVLKEIAGWLTKSYQEKKQLRGVLYLHRISDPRMGGSAKKNLFMFKKLCGTDALQNVILLTTMWEKVDQKDGERRLKALESTEEFWGFMIARGSTVRRHQNHCESALKILEQFVPGRGKNPPPEVPLAIQTEMVNGHKDLDQTGAGQELEREFQKKHEKLLQQLKDDKEELKAAINARDKELVEHFRQEQENSHNELRRILQQSEDLRISMEKIHEEKVKKLERKNEILRGSQRNIDDIDRRLPRKEDRRTMESMNVMIMKLERENAILRRSHVPVPGSRPIYPERKIEVTRPSPRASGREDKRRMSSADASSLRKREHLPRDAQEKKKMMREQMEQQQRQEISENLSKLNQTISAIAAQSQKGAKK